MPPKAPAEAVLDPEVGELCFFLNPTEHSWVVGKVLSWDPKKGAACKAKDNTNPLFKWENSEVVEKLPAEKVLNIKDEILSENVQDLLGLTVLHDSTILNVLRKRYMEDLIYTNIGAITVALNPFNFKIPWYMDDNMPKYLAEGDRIENNIPHSWAVAHNTYFEMRNASFEPYNQCILVSGESGAGKTEASKIVMKYLACLSCKEGTDDQKRAGLEVGQKITITSPPLEAFGNAKTSRNDNSSRFGKWMQVKFDGSGFLVGADITKYLLEKSRIVTAAKGERVYHSFYIMCRHKDRGRWQVTHDKDYVSTSAGGVSENKDFDTQEEFDEVQESLGKLGVPPDVVDSVWSAVAGVLIAENIQFEADGEGSKFGGGSDKWIGGVVHNWKIDRATLEREMLTTTLHMKEGDVVKKLSPAQAMDGRSALTKTLYDNEFQWLIDTCNLMLDTSSGQGRWVGLLDIFGFEDFEVNSFEQLCINLANESLQGHYNSYIFERDMEECRAEGIDVAAVVFPDNSPCLRMVSGKGGILAMLDEECSLGKGSDMGFLDKVVSACNKPEYKPFFEKKQLAKSSFIVKHYAGDVSYEVGGFLDKNRDTLKPEAKLMMRASTDSFIATLLPEPSEDAKKITVGGFFKNQVAALMEKINSTNPHWIRCIKPHPAKKPLHFHGLLCMAQLASSGVLGTVKIRKAGFPVRIPFEPFYQTYRILGVGAGLDPSNPAACSTAILGAVGIESAMGQVGKTRVFLKSDAYVLLEKEKKKALAAYGEIVQAWCMGYLGGFAVREKVHEQNKETIAKLRAEIQASLAEKRAKEAAEREERMRKEREERERAEREERELRERMASALDEMFKDQETDHSAIIAEEDREWQRMMEGFGLRAQQIQEEVKEREERRIREERERKEAEAQRLDKAIVDMQRTVRGFLCRQQLLRELVERRRAQTEFEIDAAVFRQHQRMLVLDRKRIEAEQGHFARLRAQRAVAEREAAFREAEERRRRHRREVEERKSARHRAEEQAAEEVTEAAVEEALRIRAERRQREEEERARRHAENVARRQEHERLQAAALLYRQRRARETDEMQARRRAGEEEQRKAFAGRAVQRDEARRQQQEKLQHFSKGRSAWQERESWEHERDEMLAAQWDAEEQRRVLDALSPSRRQQLYTRGGARRNPAEDAHHQLQMERLLRRVGATGAADPAVAMGSPGWVPLQVDRFSPSTPPERFAPRGSRSPAG